MNLSEELSLRVNDWCLQRMEPDPLLQRLETVLPEDREQLAFVPTELPSSIEEIMDALMKQPGIEGVSLGRSVLPPSSSVMKQKTENHYNVVATAVQIN